VRSAVLEATGDGISSMPNRVFIGDIAAGEIAPVNITITPEKATTSQLILTYKNGDNPHSVSMALPITFGIDKKRADPVMSNVQVKTDAGVYHVTGDVNNAGLETANTVMVAALSPAVPQDPYKTYVVGALKPDDFGSFEVTFSAESGTKSIPVQLSYKDTDGNIYTTVQDVKISSAPGLSTVSGETGSSSNLLPVAAAIVLVLIFVGGWAFYLRRNKK
jgi:LPXTG-motif cell wall-anchored protein